MLVLAVVKSCSTTHRTDASGDVAESDSVPPVAELSEEPKPQQNVREVERVPEVRVPRRSAPHPIRSVVSYDISFPDKEDVHMDAALCWGIKHPIENRDSAEHSKEGFVFAGSDPFYVIDSRMTSSIPYLVPRAQELLRSIGMTFMDSLSLKGVPMHRIIVSSMLRTEEDVRHLRKVNVNASPQSCHRYGTTFDICYNRYDAVTRPVRDDTLKFVLSEVLRDARRAGRCYIKYEKKQGCFHITCR